MNTHCDIKSNWTWLHSAVYWLCGVRKPEKTYGCIGCGTLFTLTLASPHYADDKMTIPCCSEGCKEIIQDTYGAANN